MVYRKSDEQMMATAKKIGWDKSQSYENLWRR
jgi:hypothetical protein